MRGIGGGKSRIFVDALFGMGTLPAEREILRVPVVCGATVARVRDAPGVVLVVVVEAASAGSGRDRVRDRAVDCCANVIVLEGEISGGADDLGGERARAMPGMLFERGSGSGRSPAGRNDSSPTGLSVSVSIQGFVTCVSWPKVYEPTRRCHPEYDPHGEGR